MGGGDGLKAIAFGWRIKIAVVMGLGGCCLGDAKVHEPMWHNNYGVCLFASCTQEINMQPVSKPLLAGFDDFSWCHLCVCNEIGVPIDHLFSP